MPELLLLLLRYGSFVSYNISPKSSTTICNLRVPPHRHSHRYLTIYISCIYSLYCTRAIARAKYFLPPEFKSDKPHFLTLYIKRILFHLKHWVSHLNLVEAQQSQAKCSYKHNRVFKKKHTHTQLCNKEKIK